MLAVENWGEILYQNAAARQLECIEEVAAGERPEALIVCTHPAVVTVGRGTQPGDIFGWTGAVIETSRGGRATYHGPSQVVIYPILNLSRDRKSFKERDLHGYMRALEASQVAALKEFGVDAEARTVAVANGPSLTGVWVKEKKIASIGIAVKKWVTYHGLALNIEADPLAFSGINPCGFQTSVMTSLEEEFRKLQRPWTRQLRSDFEQTLVGELKERLS